MYIIAINYAFEKTVELFMNLVWNVRMNFYFGELFDEFLIFLPLDLKNVPNNCAQVSILYIIIGNIK